MMQGWRWFNRRSVPPWLLLTASTLVGVLDWIGRAELVARAAGAIGLSGSPAVVWAVPGLTAAVWLAYVVARPGPMPSWSEHYALGVRWGVRGSPNGSFEMLGPYCPNAGHPDLLQLRTYQGVRDVSARDGISVADAVLCCPTCGGSYTLDAGPGVIRTIQDARAHVLEGMRASEKVRWLVTVLLVLAAFGAGFALAGY
jgi:hypothetical protein